MFDQQHHTSLTKELISFTCNATRMEPDHVSVFNSFAATPPKGVFDIAGQAFSYKWLPLFPDHIEFSQRATFQGDGFELEVLLSHDIAELTMGGDASTAMDHDLKTMVCQHFATPLIKMLSKKFDVPLRLELEKDAQVSIHDTPLQFEITAPGIRTPAYVQLACSQDITQIILAQGTGPAQKITRNPLNPKFKVVHHGLSISQPALDRLQIGDVFLGPASISAQKDWTFEVADIAVGMVRKHDRGFVLSELSVQPHKIANHGGGNMPKESLQEILESRTTAMMSIELAQGELSIRDVEEMAVGQIIEFDEDIFETVRLRVNGEMFADAEIVWVADKIGIKITGLK